jgi:hypothetical protein
MIVFLLALALNLTPFSQAQDQLELPKQNPPCLIPLSTAIEFMKSAPKENIKFQRCFALEISGIIETKAVAVPSEVIIHMMKYLNLNETFKASTVCKIWHDCQRTFLTNSCLILSACNKTSFAENSKIFSYLGGLVLDFDQPDFDYYIKVLSTSENLVYLGINIETTSNILNSTKFVNFMKTLSSCPSLKFLSIHYKGDHPEEPLKSYEFLKKLQKIKMTGVQDLSQEAAESILQEEWNPYY